MQGCTVKKSKLDKHPIDNITISKDCLGTIESIKPPFETTDEFVNRLMDIQMKYHQQKGKEFVNMVFQEKFLMCTQDFLQGQDTKSKKGKAIDETRQKIKQSLQDIFQDTKDPILPLILLLDEGVTLLFQTDFYNHMINNDDLELELEQTVDDKKVVETMI